MEEALRQRDQRGQFQRVKSMNEHRGHVKVSSQDIIRDEKGRMLRDLGMVLGRWAWFFDTLLNMKSDKPRLDIIEGLPQWPVTNVFGVEPTENELIGALRLMANVKAVVMMIGLESPRIG